MDWNDARMDGRTQAANTISEEAACVFLLEHFQAKCIHGSP